MLEHNADCAIQMQRLLVTQLPGILDVDRRSTSFSVTHSSGISNHLMQRLMVLLIGAGASVHAQSRVQVCVRDFISWLELPNLTTSLDTFASY